MDVAVPSDQNISLKEFQKLPKYTDFEIEVTKMWKHKTKIIPVVIGALGMITMIKKGTQNFIDQILGRPYLQEMQKIVLTSTAHILRKVLSNITLSPKRLKAWQKIISKQHLKELIIIIIIVIIIIITIQA